MPVKYLIISLLILTIGFANAQSKEEKRTLKKARKELSRGNFPEAKNLYKDLILLDQSNPDYYFETGLAYYNSKVQREKSVDYFEKALENSKKDTISEIFYYLGRSYQYVHRFEDAINSYNDFKNFIADNKSGLTLTRDVDRFIEMCNNGLEYSTNEDKEIQIINQGEQVNTTYPEYAPVVKKDESLMLMTSRRSSSTGGKFYHDNFNYEDIYVSVKNGDQWTWANKFDSSSTYISSKINSKWHDAAVIYSDDEKKLFIYRENHLWVSTLEGDTWSEPVRMNKNVNSKKAHEPSAFLTPDEQTLFVVSTREDGFGGRDIWWTTKGDNGEWKQLRNLGPEVNTNHDEDAPYFLEDENLLYFSSDGHSTMGGYDVFTTTLKSDSSWTTPENLGMPINSAGHDIYYTPYTEEYAYYSSSRMGGFGNMDIYKVILECQNIPNTEIKGLLLAGGSRMPLGGKIVVTDDSGNEVGEFDVDPNTGKYLMVLPPEQTYNLKLYTEDPWNGGDPHQETFTVPKQCEPFPLYQEINMRKLVSPTNKIYAQEADFMNAMFNAEDSTKTHYQIDEATTETVEDTIKKYITGSIKFNDALVAGETEVFLLNEDLEIIRFTKTYEDGSYAFRNLKQNENYIVALNADDLKEKYYGLSSNNSENGIVAKGFVELKYVDDVLPSQPLDSAQILLMDGNKDVLNTTFTTDGFWAIDNLPTDPTAIDQINASSDITYNIGSNEMDYGVSAYIRTLDPETNEWYSEYVDIIELDTSDEALAGIDFENIYFDFDKYFLRDTSKMILDKIYAFMSDHQDAVIRMDGHTDWFGTDQYNEVLSENRANSAFEYLTQKGIEEDRLIRKWFGETEPAAPNANKDGSDNPENRQLNRRVEFKVSINGTDVTIAM